MLFSKRLNGTIAVFPNKASIITIIISIVLILYILKDILVERDISNTGFENVPPNITPFHTTEGGKISDKGLEDIPTVTPFHTTSRNEQAVTTSSVFTTKRYRAPCDKKSKATIKPLRLNSDFFLELCKPLNYKSYTMLSILSMTNDSFIVSFREGNMDLFKKYLHFCIPDGIKCDTIIGPYPKSRHGCYYFSAYSALSLCYDEQMKTKYGHILNKRMDNEDLYLLNHIVSHFFR